MWTLYSLYIIKYIILYIYIVWLICFLRCDGKWRENINVGSKQLWDCDAVSKKLHLHDAWTSKRAVHCRLPGWASRIQSAFRQFSTTHYGSGRAVCAWSAESCGIMIFTFEFHYCRYHHWGLLHLRVTQLFFAFKNQEMLWIYPILKYKIIDTEWV